MFALFGEKKIPITIFDDSETILSKFCIYKTSTETGKHKIHYKPEFFYVLNPEVDYPITSNITINFTNLLDVVKNLKGKSYNTFKSFYDSEIKYNFQRITFTELLTLEILVNGYRSSDIESINFLHNYDQTKFANARITEITIREYLSELEDTYKELSEKIQIHNNIIQELLQESEPIPFEDPIIDSITYSVKLAERINLHHFFDSLTLSENIPFACFYSQKEHVKYLNSLGVTPDKDGFLFKVYSRFDHFQDFPPQNWMEEIGKYSTGIYLKVLNINDLSKRSVRLGIDSIFTNVFINEDLLIYEYETRNQLSENELIDRIYSEIDEFSKTDNLQPNTKKENEIKCHFLVSKIFVNREIFSDMIMNDRVISYFCFLNEANQNVDDKKNFYFYFHPSLIKDISKSLTILLTSYKNKNEPENSRIKITIQNSSSGKEILWFQQLFSFILQRYNSLVSEITKIYTMLAEFNPNDSNDEEFDNEDSEKRYKQLKQIDPEIFGNGFSIDCQRNKQPYYVPNENVESLRNELGSEAKVIEYPTGSGNFYACEPREDNEKDKSNTWPGLQLNKITKKYHVCCFKINQKDKKDSLYYKYLAGELNLERTDIDETYLYDDKSQAGRDYVLKANKVAVNGRYSEAPLNISYIFEISEVQKLYIPSKSRHYFTIMRFGVEISPASVLYCMEYACNPGFKMLDQIQKKSLVSKIRNNISAEDLVITRQESYFLDYPELLALANNTEKLFDVRIFMRFIEDYYKINIILTFINNEQDQYKNGNFVYPFYKHFYLRTYDYDKFVFINIFKTNSFSYKYQTEIYQDTETENFVFSEKDLLVKNFKYFNDIIYQKKILSVEKNNFSLLNFD